MMFLIALQMIVSSALLGAGPWTAAEVPSPADARLQGKAFQQLESEVRRRHPTLTQEDASRLVRVNFRQVYANYVREDGFVIKPSREQIAKRTLQLLRLQRDLEAVLVRARRSLAAPTQPSGQEPSPKTKLLREAGQLGRKIRDLFRRNFLDLNQTSFQMILGQRGEGAFLRFLLEAERISMLLDDELERYFLGTRPGVVAVNDYDRASIGVLGEALARLAKASEEQMKP